jgi:thiamine biosynthesis protein ThiS
MRVKINGEFKYFSETMSLKDLAVKLELNPDKIIIEYNGDIPEKKEYESIFIKENDKIELIHFVGGG